MQKSFLVLSSLFVCSIVLTSYKQGSPPDFSGRLLIKVGDDPDAPDDPFGRYGISQCSTYSASAHIVKMKKGSAFG